MGDMTMARPVTLFTGQWADMPLRDLARKASQWGYDGLELACWGDHFDPVRGAESVDYCNERKALLDEFGLQCWAISHHLAGQLVLDNLDERHAAFAPEGVAGSEDKMRQWAIDQMKACARAAANMGIDVVNGFTGSSIWHLLYSFPPVPRATLDAGFELLAERWNPILDVYAECGVRFALEVHPTEIAFDIVSAERALEALDERDEFGFNFDPSHLQWQGMEPDQFIDCFPDRIYHVHMKDCAVTLDGVSGILCSHLDFGDEGRGWDFRSLGRGDVDFEAIVRALNRVGYDGPLSVEWEDSGMDREHGAQEACEFVRNLDFPPSERAFDAAFDD
jgi:sugar phosphate isomerase/epimerase